MAMTKPANAMTSEELDREIARLQDSIRAATERLASNTKGLDERKNRIDYELKRAMGEEFKRDVGPQQARLDELLARRGVAR